MDQEDWWGVWRAHLRLVEITHGDTYLAWCVASSTAFGSCKVGTEKAVHSLFWTEGSRKDQGTRECRVLERVLLKWWALKKKDSGWKGTGRKEGAEDRIGTEWVAGGVEVPLWTLRLRGSLRLLCLMFRWNDSFIGLTHDAGTHLMSLSEERACGPEQRRWQDWDRGDDEEPSVVIGVFWYFMWILVPEECDISWSLCHSEVIKLLTKAICFKASSLYFLQHRGNLIFSG